MADPQELENLRQQLEQAQAALRHQQQAYANLAAQAHKHAQVAQAAQVQHAQVAQVAHAGAYQLAAHTSVFKDAVKNIKPKAFNGTKDSIALPEFIWKLEKFFDLMAVPDPSRLASLPLFLEGNAAQFWRVRIDHRPEHERPQTFAEALSILKDMYMDKLLAQKARCRACSPSHAFHRPSCSACVCIHGSCVLQHHHQPQLSARAHLSIHEGMPACC
jgi:hypothetical protein